MNITSQPHSVQYPSPSVSHPLPLRVVVSLDVEEEGLFSGRYAVAGYSVRNVALLSQLAPLTTELGFPLTLLCAHSVLADPAARDVLLGLHENHGAEIGAHLHHWSTPPLSLADGSPDAAAAFLPSHGPQRTDRLPRELLRARLRTLLNAGRELLGAPMTSFRMGRWDLKNSVRPLLAEEGLVVDSSVCPLRVFEEGPDHFLAPSDPYWLECGGRRLLEAPITQIPLHPAVAKLWYAAGLRLPLPRRQKFLDTFHFWGALSPNPVWHHAQVMRACARLHRRRGGKVLSLFWHSSEMLPGASPNVPSQAAADALLRKIYDYLAWLRTACNAQGVTLSELARDTSFPVLVGGEGDW